MLSDIVVQFSGGLACQNCYDLVDFVVEHHRFSYILVISKEDERTILLAWRPHSDCVQAKVVRDPIIRLIIQLAVGCDSPIFRWYGPVPGSRTALEVVGSSPGFYVIVYPVHC